METKNSLPDVNQLQGHMQYYIAWLLVNNKPELLNVIRQNGVVLSNNPTDKEILTAVFIGIKNSKPFRKSLQDLMTSHAAKELNMAMPGSGGMNSSNNGKTIDQFVKGGANFEDGFKNYANWSGALLGGANPATYTNPGTNEPHTWNPDDPTEGSYLSQVKTLEEVVVSTKKNPTQPKNPVVTTPSTKKKFSETALGGFLGNLFTSDNVSKAAGVGIDLLGNKLSANANTQEANAATALQIAQTEKLKAQIAADQSKKSWLVPVIIIGALVLAGIVVAVVVSKNKKAA